MRISFSPELVPLLPHAMRKVFPKLENDLTDGPLRSLLPLSPLTPVTSTPPLIPKPLGEVGHVKHGGYMLRDVLEKQYKWEDGLYHKIRVCSTHF